MQLWGFSLLLLARISVNQAQLKRQRTGKLEPAQGSGIHPTGGVQQDPVSLTRDCPFPLLPWALLLALLGTWALYFLFTRRQRRANLDPEGDALLERTLLRDVASVLHVIRPRLWQIAQTQRKQRRLGDESTVKHH